MPPALGTQRSNHWTTSLTTSLTTKFLPRVFQNVLPIPPSAQQFSCFCPSCLHPSHTGPLLGLSEHLVLPVVQLWPGLSHLLFPHTSPGSRWFILQASNNMLFSPGNLPWSFLGTSYHSSHYIVTVHLEFCLPSTWEPLEDCDGL